MKLVTAQVLDLNVAYLLERFVYIHVVAVHFLNAVALVKNANS